MVRSGIPQKRAKKGIIPGDPFKTRAKTVHFLIKKFGHKFSKEQRTEMANLGKEILEVGDADYLFLGKDPFISGVAIFVYLTRRVYPYRPYAVTYGDIREESAHFASGANFVKLLKDLKKRFG
ncbi:MAG: hypothetical protein PVG23_04045 [Nitrosopumilaceae archaeon]|jgi:hypothetical protein